MIFVAFKGATRWEMQIGRVCFYWPFWRYIRVGMWPHIEIDRSE